MTEKEINQLIADHKVEESRKPVRKVYGIKISEDFGKTWRIRALCQKCYEGIEPPKMAKKEIEAGTYSCDWCGCRNEMYVGREEWQKQKHK